MALAGDCGRQPEPKHMRDGGLPMAYCDPKPLPELTPDFIEHFNQSIDRRSANECWDWLKGKECGYGRIRYGERRILSHRVAYYIAYGVDPGSLDVCHVCDRPPCCNPAHLTLGEHADNMHDMGRKGRCIKKLSNGQVSDMRTLYDDFGYSQASLSRIFGVSDGLVSLIVRRRKRIYA